MPQETSSISAKSKTPSDDRSLGVGPLFLLPDRCTRRAPSEVAQLVNELKGFIFPD
jgi:hypothetical protein